MDAVAEAGTTTVALRMKPGESIAEFAARVAQAHGPLTGPELARLRKVFAPTAPKQVKAATPAPTGTAA